MAVLVVVICAVRELIDGMCKADVQWQGSDRARGCYLSPMWAVIRVICLLEQFSRQGPSSLQHCSLSVAAGFTWKMGCGQTNREYWCREQLVAPLGVWMFFSCLCGDGCCCFPSLPRHRVMPWMRTLSSDLSRTFLWEYQTMWGFHHVPQNIILAVSILERLW